MKNLLILILFTFATISVNAQFNQRTDKTMNDSEVAFSKKGKILIETGYSILGIFGGGTTFYLINGNNQSISSFGLEGGYFVSDRFAIKGLISRISAGEDNAINTVGVMGKYYIADKAPLELGVRSLDAGGGDNSIIYNLNIGYGIELAPNIYLEPSLGILAGDDFGDSITTFKINFAMFL